MTKSYNTTRNPEADSCPNDFGVPERLYGKKGQIVGEWELLSQEEKERLYELELDTI